MAAALSAKHRFRPPKINNDFLESALVWLYQIRMHHEDSHNPDATSEHRLAYERHHHIPGFVSEILDVALHRLDPVSLDSGAGALCYTNCDHCFPLYGSF